MKKIFFIIVFAATFLPMKSQEMTVQEHANMYETEIRKGNYKAALSHMKKCFDMVHSMLSAIILGDMYTAGLGTPVDYATAIKYYKAVADIDINKYPPSDEEKIIIAYACRTVAGVIDLQNPGNELFFPEIIKYVEKAVIVNDDALALWLLGNYHIHGKIKAVNSETIGLDYLKRSAAKKCICANMELGSYYDQRGEMDLAMEYYLRTANTPLYVVGSEKDIYETLINPNLDNNPVVVDYWNSAVFNIGKIYYDEDDPEEALLWLKKLTLEKTKYLNLKAQCYAILKQEKEAVATVKRSLEIEEDPKLYHLLGIFYYVWGNKEESERYLKIAQSKGCKEAEATYRKYILEEGGE